MIWIVLDPDECPADPEATAEAYLLDRLAPEEARVFEDHYITCDRCARVLEAVREGRRAGIAGGYFP